MTPALVSQLSSDLMAAGLTFTANSNPDLAGDWIVTVRAPSGVRVDAKNISALERKYGISSPVTNEIFFV